MDIMSLMGQYCRDRFTGLEGVVISIVRLIDVGVLNNQVEEYGKKWKVEASDSSTEQTFYGGGPDPFLPVLNNGCRL